MRAKSPFATIVARQVLPVISAVCLSGFGFSGPASAGTLNDSQILGIYIQVNSFDIETALLGRANSGSDAVRSLAEHVASDHLGVRQSAFALPEKCKATPVLPAERNAAAMEHSKTMDKLATLKGSEFDKAYVRYEVDFHRAAIAAVRADRRVGNASGQRLAALEEG
jgi:putative membrane protein